MSDQMAEKPFRDTRPKEFKELIYSLVHTVNEILGGGDVAELKRLRPEQFGSPAFWKIVVTHLNDDNFRQIGGKDQDEIEKRWSTLVSAIAHTKGLHNPSIRLGTALFEAGLHELRFIQLLRARGDRLLKAISTTAQVLASQAEPFDVCDLAKLIASDGRHWAETFRKDIAKAYYANLS